MNWITCNYSSLAFKDNSEQNSYALVISCKSIRNYVNRSSATNKEYELPIAEDKAGDYVCKVTIGAIASAESAPSTIAAEGLSLGILHLYKYKHEL